MKSYKYCIFNAMCNFQVSMHLDKLPTVQKNFLSTINSHLGQTQINIDLLESINFIYGIEIKFCQ